jgi:hypothetical protein
MFTTLRCTKFLISPSTPQLLFKSSSPKGGKSPLLSLPLSINGSLLSYKDIPLPSKQHLEDRPATVDPLPSSFLSSWQVDHLLLLSYVSNVNLSLSIFTPLLGLWGVLNLSIPCNKVSPWMIPFIPLGLLAWMSSPVCCCPFGWAS